MSNDLGSMSIGLGVDTRDLISGFAIAREHINGFAGIVAGAALGLAGFGIAATKMAGDFQESMTQLVTGAGESEKNLAKVSSGILNMSVQTATATDKLSAGMYMIESAGYHGADGLKVLQAAAEGAKVGNADLASVSNGVTTALTDYHLSASHATQVTNDLIATVASGKTHMQELATALSTILPTSAAVGVSLHDTSAAMATMTGEGTDAATAATYLRQLLLALEVPASKGAAALKDIGLSTANVASEMKKSLPDTLQMITDALGKKFPVGSAAYVAALKDIAGGSKQMEGILELTGSHLATFKDNLTGITEAVKKGGSAITGWALVQQDFNFKLEQAQAAFSKLMITVGNAFLPLLTRVMGAFSSLVTTLTPAIDSFAALLSQRLGEAFSALVKWIEQYIIPDFKLLMAYFQSPIFMDFYKMLAYFIGTALKDIAQVVENVLLPTFVSFIELVGKLAVSIGGFISHIDFSGVVGVLKDLWNVVSSVFSYITHYDFSPLLTTLHNLWNTFLQIAGILKGPLESAFNLVGSIIETAFNLAMRAATLFFAGLNGLLQAAQPYIQQFANFFQNTIAKPVEDLLGKINNLLNLLGKGPASTPPSGPSHQGSDGVSARDGSGASPSGRGITAEQVDQLNQWDNAWWALAGAIDGAKQALSGFLSGVGTRLASFLTDLTTGLRIWGEHLGPLMASAWKAIWPQISPILSDLWTNIQNVFRDSAKIAGRLVFLALDTLGGNWHQFNQDMNKLGAEVLDWIKDGVGGQLHVIADIAGVVGQTFAAAFIQPIIDAWNQSGLGAIFGALGSLGGIDTFAAKLFGGLAGGLANPDKSSSDYWKNHAPPAGGLPNYPSFGGGSVGHFASGVTNFPGGLAYVHAGETLVNLAPGTDVLPAGAAGGSAAPIIVQFTLDSEMIGQHVVDAMRLRAGTRQ